MPRITYVKQRYDWDCAIAALAMATGCDYETVAAETLVPGRTESALNDTLVKEWLIKRGRAWQEKMMTVWRGRDRWERSDPWPPAPFAPVHLCMVEATAGMHYCVMDGSGRIYDPANPERDTLSHPEYKRVSSVAGLFEI